VSAAEELAAAEEAAAGCRAEHEAASVELAQLKLSALNAVGDPAEASVRVAEQLRRLTLALDATAAAVAAADERADRARQAVVADRAAAGQYESPRSPDA
jgi:hypothetical protein